MKKIASLPVFTILLLVLAGILVFLYTQSRGIDSEAYNRVDENLRTLKQLDAEWNVNVLRSKVGSNQDYDPLTSPQTLIRELRDDLSHLANQLEEGGNILPTVNQYQQAMQDKLNLIEDFKSQHAIFKNSLSFLPTAVEQLQTEINSRVNALDVELSTAENSDILQDNNALTASNQLKTHSWQLWELRSQSNTLLTELLKYNLTPDEELKARISSIITGLEEEAGNYEESLSAQIAVLLTHSRTVLRQRDIEEEILTGLDTMPTEALNDQLNQLVSESFERKLAQQDEYRRYLMIYAGALLLLLMYAAYRLLRAFRDLRNANENLEQNVVARTADLNQALHNLKESQAQLVQSEKMASLGQMVAGITHEINTPLAYVRSGLEITQMRIGELGELVGACNSLRQTLTDENASDGAIHQQLQQVGEISSMLEENETVSETNGLLDDGLHGMDQISEIISSLKNFSRMDRANVAAFNVNDGLDSTLKIANNIVKHKTVIKQYGDVRPITCSPSSINQVFLNLITNAAQATGDDGEITITTKQLGDVVQIEVRDNGKGIPADTVGKIFDPFFTTKEIGEGTGLGLSIVQRIINEHNGSISVESEQGQGTCFTVVLPDNTVQEG